MGRSHIKRVLRIVYNQESKAGKVGGLGPHPQEKTHEIRMFCQIATPLRGMEVDLHAILISGMSSYVFCQPYSLEKIRTVIIIA
jgi:hypothetical protein